MYVFACIKHLVKSGIKRASFPTQIAGIKVDDGMNITDRLTLFIRPEIRDFCDWHDPAFSGGTAVDFRRACSAKEALTRFCSWLDKSDTLVWWDDNSENMYAHYVKKYLRRTVPQQAVAISKALNRVFNPGEKKVSALHKFASSALNIAAPYPYSAGIGVEMLLALARAAGYPRLDEPRETSAEQQTPATPPKTPAQSRREKTLSCLDA